MSQTADSGEVAYADGTILVDVLGGGTKVRILEVLLSEYDRDLNASDISRLAGIGTSSFYNHIDTLRAYGLVEQTRTVGNSPMYQINTESEAAQALARFDWKLIKTVGEKEAAGELDEDNRPIVTD